MKNRLGRFLAFCLGVACFEFSCTGRAPVTSERPDVRGVNVVAGQEVAFPFTLTGEARGSWYFEASFPVRVEDGNGDNLVEHSAQAQGEWMTEDFVPFTADLSPSVAIPPGEATLVIEKANASGLPEHADAIRIPILISGDTMTIAVYFINQDQDPQRLDCSRVDAVSRTVPKSVAAARVALEKLLAGPIASEKQAGFITVINPDVTVASLSISDGVAHVTFSSELQEGVGGSCRVTTIRSQIDQTLMQFPSVTSVRISVEGYADDEVLQP
jgi:hypothetical protein